MSPVLKAALIIGPIWIFVIIPLVLIGFRRLLRFNAEHEWLDDAPECCDYHANQRIEADLVDARFVEMVTGLEVGDS